MLGRSPPRSSASPPCIPPLLSSLPLPPLTFLPCPPSGASRRRTTRRRGRSLVSRTPSPITCSHMAYPAGSPLRLLPPGAAAKDKEDPRLLRDPPPPLLPHRPPSNPPPPKSGGSGSVGQRRSACLLPAPTKPVSHVSTTSPPGT